MIGEISIAGVYLPTLLIVGFLALILTALMSQLATHVGIYRLIAYRPLVDVALFFIILELLSTLMPSLGLHL
ncbi:DUF1656 domain-containing protein [Sphingobium sp. CCH11-B1]|uniref:DUF1656 domain-containing protein n=1 Tax=Sphingobium sp. CCH11-B1 TaxID=1768781 RepID=UPI00082A78E3|nr:DUF1656 domain-containing protein [Sphingobium sp. CCH11-B1]